MVSSILPKNKRLNNFHYIRLSQRSFFWKNQGHHNLLLRCIDLFCKVLSRFDFRFGHKSKLQIFFLSSTKIVIRYQNTKDRKILIFTLLLKLINGIFRKMFFFKIVLGSVDNFDNKHEQIKILLVQCLVVEVVL